MIPPSAFLATTAISTPGVVQRPTFITFTPQPSKVPSTRSFTISPDNLASLPRTTVSLRPGFLPTSHFAYEAVNFTASRGVRLSPIGPPIVPLIPEIDLISVIYGFL